jgi:hypothetical protein
MFINIVTPCSRPENLHSIYLSINIPVDNYRWIIVYDGLEIPDKKYIPNNCEIYSYYDINSCYGQQQRNYALSLINSGHVYFNDDDTIIHSELWENIKDLDNDFITFNQNTNKGNVRLHDCMVKEGSIDSHNFIFKRELSEGFRFVNEYNADGIFATEIFQNSKSYIHISKVLSIYNSLR